MSLRPNARTEVRRNRYKVAVGADEGRRRREDGMVEIRKNRLLKKRREGFQSAQFHQLDQLSPNLHSSTAEKKDCVGAIDGTHVRVKVSKRDAPRYRGRKDCTTTNVLACCTFDMCFSYVLAGWEGSASDSRILKDALTRADPLRIPSGRYYLGDSGFGLSTKVLVPYSNTRYHLKEYDVRGPQNYKELFNHRHASLRNTIERTFGVLKKRFPIVGSGAESYYSCVTMRDIVIACCVVHNFLIKYCPFDTTDVDGNSANSQQGEVQVQRTTTAIHVGISGNEFERGRQMREDIAQTMWRDYENNHSGNLTL